MNVVVMPAAEADLLAIGAWIAKDNPIAAETFVEELREICRKLALAARGYPLIERYKRIGIRRRAHKNYLIFYRVAARQIEIVHVLHGARDYQPMLSDEFE